MSIDQFDREVKAAQKRTNEVVSELEQFRPILNRLAEVAEQNSIQLARVAELIELWREEHPDFDDDDAGEEWKAGGGEGDQ